MDVGTREKICFPVVAVSSGYVDVLEDPASLDERLAGRNAVTAVAGGFYDDLELYDAAGTRWKVELEHPSSPRWWWKWTPLLPFVHSVPVRLAYTNDGEYELEELKDSLLGLLHSPGDPLTRYVDADDIIGELERCRNFRDTLRLLYEIGVAEPPAAPAGSREPCGCGAVAVLAGGDGEV